MKLLNVYHKTFIAAGTLAILCAQSHVLAQDNQELAAANEVIISASPLHDEIAEKYLKSATGESEVAIADVTNSAIKLSIPLDESIEEGTIVDNDHIDAACKKFHTYIRKLRQNNAQARENNERTKIVYNMQCSPNSIVTASILPNDPYSNPNVTNYLWAIDQSNNVDMDLPAAWDKSIGNSEIVVAIIDTGINYNHPDLAANMWKNPLELGGITGVDDDGNGIVDDIYGYNAIYNATAKGDPLDDHSHGSHVAGTIGGVGNNGLGIVGASWNVKMMALKFLAANGGGQNFDAIKAIDYVTNMKNRGVNIVASNNSWGSPPGAANYDPSMLAAIQRASNAGVLFIAAAGNNGAYIDNVPCYPASYDSPNVISVAAIDRNGALASFSNYGVNNVDIAAPGVAIYSSVLGSSYATYNGTSMATPQVTGVIALLKGYAPLMSMTELRDTLFSTGKSVAGAIGKTKYGVMPSALNMLLEADRLGYGGVPPPPTVTPTPRPTATPTLTPTPTRTPTPTPTIAPGYFAIRGTIKVGQTKLASAKVKLEINGQTIIAYSDANGEFSFINVYGPANYTITVTSAGNSFSTYGSNLIGNINLNLSGTIKNYSLKAKVTDHLGQALAGVEINDPVLGTRITSSLGIAEFTVPYGTIYGLSAQRNNDDFLAPTLSGQVYGDVTRSFVKLPD